MRHFSDPENASAAAKKRHADVRALKARVKRVEAWEASRKAMQFDKQSALDGLAYLATAESLTPDELETVKVLRDYARSAPDPRDSAEHLAARRSRAAELKRGRPAEDDHGDAPAD